MEIQKQVCSLELANFLHEMGITQDSYFYWYESDLGWTIDHFSKAWGSHISAFTASELFDILPARIDIGKDEPYNYFRLNMTRYLICLDNKQATPSMVFSLQYECDTAGDKTVWFFNKLFPHNVWDESMPNALAMTIIELNKLGYLHFDKG